MCPGGELDPCIIPVRLFMVAKHFAPDASRFDGWGKRELECLSYRLVSMVATDKHAEGDDERKMKRIVDPHCNM